MYSKSSVDGSPGHVWISDGSGKYSLAESSDAEAGTKIVLHLKSSEAEFSDENHVKDIIKKYSNFVGSDVNLNNTKVNQLKPTWLMDPKEVDEETHADFYRYVANAFDKPRFTLHYRADAPMDIRALFYVPESRPGMDGNGIFGIINPARSLVYQHIKKFFFGGGGHSKIKCLIVWNQKRKS